jgi:hypothetical protein
MPKDQRKALRRQVDALGFLYTTDGQPLGECRMTDVSTGGARLVHSIAAELPEAFLLSLSKNGSVRRLCQIVWREKSQIGVSFLVIEPAREVS